MSSGLGPVQRVSNGLALFALHHRLPDHGAITVGEGLRVWARSMAGSSAQDLLEKLDGGEIRLPANFTPTRVTCAGTTARFSSDRCDIGRSRGCACRSVRAPPGAQEDVRRGREWGEASYAVSAAWRECSEQC